MNQGAATSVVSSGSLLLVSNDPKTVQLLRECLQQFALAVEVSADPALALQRLEQRKFEGVIADRQLGEAADMLIKQVRLSPANRTAVTFAISEVGKSAGKPDVEANFSIQRPLSAESVLRTVKAAYGMIVRERRRYFRCPVKIPVEIRKQGEQIQCEARNLSEGGLAVNTAVPLRPGSQVGVQFSLPGLPTELLAESEICWYDEQSAAGLQFLWLSVNHQSELQGWLSKKLEETLPASVVNKFQGGSA